MKNMSLIQEYMLCAVNEKGRFSGLDTEKSVCFIAAGLLDLEMAGCIAIENKKVAAVHDVPAHMSYLGPMYEMIDSKKSMKINSIIEAYRVSFSDKHFNELVETVGDSLIDLGAAEAESGGFTGRKKKYIPKAEAVSSVVRMMKAEFMEEGQITEETAALIILLENARCLRTYFSEFEHREIKEKLKALTDSPEGKAVKDMVEYVEGLMAVICLSAVTSATI